MAKQRDTHFVCQQCGAVSPRWAGRCEACGSWNSLVEEIVPSGPPKSLAKSLGKSSGVPRLVFTDLQASEQTAKRLISNMSEFDRVCGGGLVPGSALLIGGDPGIGKSTLLLQIMARYAKEHRAIYISGEEATEQVRLRAQRLGLAAEPVALAAATSIRDIVATLRADPPALVVIDSIQTMYVDMLDSAPGTVAQVRAAAQELIRAAKETGFTLLLVGHVTKDGLIAGPRVLEHMVDCVLYFEGDRGHQFRILRAVKNRFGPTDEIGVFAMSDRGLEEVKNPSALFLAQRRDDIAGSVVFAGLEGTRPMLVEIQALVSQPTSGTPRRAVVGWDHNRLAMILAVLEARAGIQLSNRDIYLNIAGGLRISEPAADLAAAAALLSAFSGQAVLPETVVFGEIGLGGEIRPVSQTDLRLREATKLGFQAAWLPEDRRSNISLPPPSLQRIKPLSSVQDLAGFFNETAS